MKAKGFLFFLIVVLAALIVLWANNVFGQEMQQDSTKAVYPADLDKIQKMGEVSPFPAESKIVINVYASGGKEKGTKGRDPDLWGLRAQAAEVACAQWDLEVVDIIYHLGADKAGASSYFEKGKAERGVAIVLVPPDSTAERLDGLEGEFNSHVANQTKKDSVQAETNATYAMRLKNFNSRLAYVEGAVGNLKIPRLSLGVGATSVYYLQNNYAIVPTIYVYGRLTNRFGWQATGGILPTDSEMFDGVASLAIFVKPISFVKIYSGYLLESYFDKNFQWARDIDRTDAATLSVGLEKSYGKLNGEVAVGGFRDFRNGRWGMVNLLTITFNF